METKDEDEIKRIMKKAYPQIVASAKDKVCPSEDALSAFAEGKLKGKKEEEVVSHLAVCNDCLGLIKFLRQAPSEEEVSVPLWLERTVCDLLPEEPRTWEIVVGHAKAFLEVIKHTADICLTIPQLEPVPAKMSPAPAFATLISDRLLADEKVMKPSSEMNLARSALRRQFRIATRRPIAKKPRGKSARVSEEVFAMAKSELGVLEERIRPPVPTAEDSILRDLSKRISSGFVFLEHIGPYEVYLALSKGEDNRPEIFEVGIDVYDRSGRFAEEIEVSFVQGRKTIGKSVTRKETRISKSLLPERYSIKFKHKGLDLGQALLDLRA